jgi:very-short-patch-repair endonuclease
VTPWPYRDVWETATRQLGLITRIQLYELGVGRGAIDHAMKCGLIRQIHRGVYAVGHSSLPPFASEMAAVLAAGDGALLSHRSAAAMWGLIAAVKGDIHVTVVGHDRARTRPGIRIHRIRALDTRDATSLHAIPITSPARTLLDITPDLRPRGELERTFDAALKGRIVTRSAVAATVARNGGRPGAPLLAALAQAELPGPADTRSQAEDQLRRLIRAGDLPEPVFNARVGRYTIDALWPRHRLAVEVDGYAFHSTRRSFESDHERDLVLSAAGFTVMRFTRDQIVKQPELVLVRLAQRLGEIEAQWVSRGA